MPKKYNDEQKECFERLFLILQLGMYRKGTLWNSDGIHFMDTIEETMECLKKNEKK